MKIPLTVALLTYNRVNYLRESISSILNQTYSNFELLILDNHSTDGTAEYILSIDDCRIRYVRNSIGMAPEFNGYSAVKIARGDKVLIFHDDDVMEYDMLENAMKEFFKNPKITAVWCNHRIINLDGAIVLDRANPGLNSLVYGRYAYFEDFPNTIWWPYPSGLFFTRKYYPNYSERYYLDQDLPRRSPAMPGADPLTLIWMNLKGPVSVVGSPLFRYRKHPAQETNKIDISNPVLLMYRRLYSLAKRYMGNDSIVEIYKGLLLKYEIQKFITTRRKFPFSAADVKKFDALANRALISGERGEFGAYYYIVGIMCGYFGRESLKFDLALEANSHFNLLVREWLRIKRGKINIYDGLPCGISIGILGSSLIGTMLLIEARIYGFKEIYVFDSNVNRIGSGLIGQEIKSTSSIPDFSKVLELIVTSSEREQQGAILDMLGKYAPNVKCLSWKQLIEGKTQDLYRSNGKD